MQETKMAYSLLSRWLLGWLHPNRFYELPFGIERTWQPPVNAYLFF